jgi:uncharacterized membrane protein
VYETVLIAIGAVLLAVSWICWSGRWRAWAKLAMLPAAPITALPAFGLVLVLVGAAMLLPEGPAAALGVLAFLVAVAGFGLWMWDPSWYGPRWYRERDTTYDLSVPLNAAIAASVRSEPGEASEALARSKMGWREPEARWRAHLISDAHGRPSAMQRIGVVRGHLFLYPDAVVFAADLGEDRMRGSAVVEIVPAAAIVSVRRVPAGSRPDGERAGPDLPSRVMPRLRIDTTSGAYVFETPSAGRRARELEARYVGAVPAPG